MIPEPIAFVYIIRNSVNKKVYIGITKLELRTRLNNHFSLARDGYRYKYNQRPGTFLDDILFYGKKSFSIELIENVYNMEDAREIEDYWISRFFGENCYNSLKKSHYGKKF